MPKRPILKVRILPDGQTFTTHGRNGWALLELVAAGAKGRTPIDNPGPRWSAYVFNLRALGLAIETRHEGHKGPFAGTHARYVLHSPMEIIEVPEAEAEAA